MVTEATSRGEEAAAHKIKAKRLIPPYIWEYFNVHEFDECKATGIKFAMVRIVNAFVEGIRQRKRLPMFLLVIPDQNLIQDVDVYDKDALIILHDMVGWMVRQLDVIMRRIKMYILEIKPGALVGMDPKIIHVCMLRQACTFSEESR